jgi:hypothetical protein
LPFRTRRLLTSGECDFRSVTTPLQEIIATWRNRIEASFGEITDLMDLARHGCSCLSGACLPNRSDHRRSHLRHVLPGRGLD